MRKHPPEVVSLSLLPNGHFFLKTVDLHKGKHIIPQVNITDELSCLHFPTCQKLKDLLPAVKYQYPAKELSTSKLLKRKWSKY